MTSKAGSPTLTHAQAVDELHKISEELERLAALETLTPEQEQEFSDLRDTFHQVDLHRKQLERADELARVREAALGLTGGTRRVPGTPTSSGRDYDKDPIAEPDSVEDGRFADPWNLDEVRTFGRTPEAVQHELRARALSAVERMSGATDSIREAATKIIEEFDDKNSTIARMCLATSRPEYLRGWSKLARNEGHSMTPEESAAIDAVRAMSLTDANGGYLVPFQLDPTVIITSAGSRNDIRQAARQVVATGDKWNGVSSGAVQWSWDGEATQVSDDATTFGQPVVDLHKAQGFVPISIEALQDEQNVTAEVARLLAFGKDSLEAEAFITGDGDKKPIGIVTALTGTGSEINAAADDTFALADVYTIQGSLPARHRANASWLANNLIYNKIRQFDTSGGAGLWARLGEGRPDGLLGRQVLEAEAMDGVIGTTGAVSNYILVFGDFSNYVIADRIGMQIEFIPHLFGANQRPTGQRGWYAYYRVGADSVNDDAFRMLDVASAA